MLENFYVGDIIIIFVLLNYLARFMANTIMNSRGYEHSITQFNVQYESSVFERAY